MNTNEEWRDQLGGELEQMAERMIKDRQPVTAGCLSILAGAVYGSFEMGLGHWMLWFVRWQKLVWWIQEQMRRTDNEAE